VTSKEGKGKMKPLVNGRFVIAVLTVACLTIVLLTVAPIGSGSPSAGEYDPWLDWNDDGKINMIDISRAAKAFGTSGQNITKGSLQYDSGWVDLTGETSQNYTITHDLGLSSTDMIVDARQRYGWNKTYESGAGDDWAYALVRTTDGGYALAGATRPWSYGFGVGDFDFWLIKTDASGTMQWNKTYGGTGGDEAYALVQTNDGGYALAGYGFANLVKTDADGNMEWTKSYGGTPFALVQTNDGGYALAGYHGSFGAGEDGGFWLAKTDASGNELWNETYGATGFDGALALVQTSDGGYALAGGIRSFSTDNGDFWLVKTDALGHAQWNKTYGDDGSDDWTYALVQTNDEGYALAGSKDSVAWWVKTDAYGNMQWNKTYGGWPTCFFDVIQTRDGGYALAGITHASGGTGMADFWLVKTDASGTMMWTKSYATLGEDWAYALVETSDGGYALAGYTNPFGLGNPNHAWLVRTEVESGLVWTESSSNAIILYRGTVEPYWNYVRVRLWKPR
jgi:hypothetical protein